ncbi:MAG: Rieske (2Fe-2S) protein [Flavobacteriales bacterium]
MKKQYVFLVGFLLIALALGSCKKNVQRAFYPPVDEYINITLISYNALQAPGGWAYVNGGLKGIIVYARGGNEFVAYDRNCTFEEENSCGIATVATDNITIECSCDGSTYNIFDGSVTNGPAELPLKGYNVSFNSSNSTIRIYG